MTQDKKAAPRVAVIGAGHWGKNLVRDLNSIGALEMVCDSMPGTLEKIESQYPGVQIVRTIDEVLNSKDVDAVCVSTPAITHFEIARKCLNAGKHVFVEKPLCVDVDDGQRLVELADEKNLVLMVGHLLHYHAAVIKLKELVETGELGNLQYIYSNRLNLGKIRTEENSLWSFAPHDISVILAMAGQMPISISSFGSNFLNAQIADVTLSRLIFASGLTAHIFVSWLHPLKEQRLVVVGDEKMVVFDDVEPENKLLVFPHRIDWQQGIPVPDKRDAIKIDLDMKPPLQEELKAFIEAISDGRKLYTDGREGLNVLKVLTACEESMEHHGKAVSFHG